MVSKSTIKNGEIAKKALQEAVLIEVEKKAKLGQDIVISENGVMVVMKAEEALRKYKQKHSQS